MEKIAINPHRLKWCMNTVQIDIEYLSSELHIAKPPLVLAMDKQEVLSVTQLEKIANYFKRSLFSIRKVKTFVFQANRFISNVTITKWIIVMAVIQFTTLSIILFG